MGEVLNREEAEERLRSLGFLSEAHIRSGLDRVRDLLKYAPDPPPGYEVRSEAVRRIYEAHVRWLDQQMLDREQAKLQIRNLFPGEALGAIDNILDHAHDLLGSASLMTMLSSTSEREAQQCAILTEILRHHVRWLNQQPKSEPVAPTAPSTVAEQPATPTNASVWTEMEESMGLLWNAYQAHAPLDVFVERVLDAWMACVEHKIVPPTSLNHEPKDGAS